MAKITEFELVDRERSASRHSETRAQYGIFTEAGRRYVQIETVGSTSRKAKNVVSQSILLDEKGITELMRILAAAIGEA